MVASASPMHGEVLEVDLRLSEELLALVTGHWRQRPSLDRRGAVAEALDHLLGVELGHAFDGTERLRRVRRLALGGPGGDEILALGARRRHPFGVGVGWLDRPGGGNGSSIGAAGTGSAAAGAGSGSSAAGSGASAASADGVGRSTQLRLRFRLR